MIITIEQSSPKVIMMTTNPLQKKPSLGKSIKMPKMTPKINGSLRNPSPEISFGYAPPDIPTADNFFSDWVALIAGP